MQLIGVPKAPRLSPARKRQVIDALCLEKSTSRRVQYLSRVWNNMFISKSMTCLYDIGPSRVYTEHHKSLSFFNALFQCHRPKLCALNLSGMSLLCWLILQWNPCAITRLVLRMGKPTQMVDATYFPSTRDMGNRCLMDPKVSLHDILLHILVDY